MGVCKTLRMNGESTRAWLQTNPLTKRVSDQRDEEHHDISHDQNPLVLLGVQVLRPDVSQKFVVRIHGGVRVHLGPVGHMNRKFAVVAIQILRGPRHAFRGVCSLQLQDSRASARMDGWERAHGTANLVSDDEETEEEDDVPCVSTHSHYRVRQRGRSRLNKQSLEDTHGNRGGGGGGGAFRGNL